jgi:hypothetical protein
LHQFERLDFTRLFASQRRPVFPHHAGAGGVMKFMRGNSGSKAAAGQRIVPEGRVSDSSS